MRTTLICNPQSGGGTDAEGTADALRKRGMDIVETAHSPQEARAEAVERIVAVGGDGTLAPAAKLAADRGVPLSVIPGGTANDFARAMDIPLDPADAVACAAAGDRRRELELAFMDGRPFLNAASAGLSPAAARRAAPFKRRLGPLAYAAGGVLAGLREHPITCAVTVDDRAVFAGDAWQITVAATGAFGGGAEIGQADPHDGLLDVVVVPAGPRAKLPLVGVQLRRGTLTGERGDDIVVHVPEGTAFNVDGELVRAGGDVSFTARAAAFTLIG